MSLWRRLLGSITGERNDRPGAAQPDGALAAAVNPDEVNLRRLIHDLSRAQPGASAIDEGHHAALERLWTGGGEAAALDLLKQLAILCPGNTRLGLHLSQRLIQTGEREAAISVLENIVRAPALPIDHAITAHALLADAHAALGQEEHALRNVEALMAYDLDHPRARGHRDMLKRGASAEIVQAHEGVLSEALVPTVLGAQGIRHDRYELLRELGRGSAGTVYLGRDNELSRELAIKVFHPLGQDAAPMAWNEARLAALVRHPGVIAVYELDDQRGLMVMELCRSGTLRQRLQGGRLSAPIALYRALEISSALEVVHLSGVAHGDLKPGNLLFRGSGSVLSALAAGGTMPGGLPASEGEYGDLVIADFGLGRLVGQDASLPAGGTLCYLSPERRLGEPPDAPGDVYALGIIILEMLLGAPPLTPEEVLRGVRARIRLDEDGAPDLGERRAALTSLLREVLAEDASARPRAAEITEALRDLTRGCPAAS